MPVLLLTITCVRTHPAAEQGRRQEDLRIEQLGFYMFFLQSRCKTVKSKNFAVVSLGKGLKKKSTFFRKKS